MTFIQLFNIVNILTKNIIIIIINVAKPSLIIFSFNRTE